LVAFDRTISLFVESSTFPLDRSSKIFFFFPSWAGPSLSRQRLRGKSDFFPRAFAPSQPTPLPRRKETTFVKSRALSPVWVGAEHGFSRRSSQLVHLSFSKSRFFASPSVFGTAEEIFPWRHDQALCVSCSNLFLFRDCRPPSRATIEASPSVSTDFFPEDSSNPSTQTFSPQAFFGSSRLFSPSRISSNPPTQAWGAFFFLPVVQTFLRATAFPSPVPRASCLLWHESFFCGKNVHFFS